MYWDLPGGRLQRGETPLQALTREVREETGLAEISEATPFMMALTDIRITNAREDVGLIFSIYLIRLQHPFQPILSDEHTDFEWCSIHSAVERLQPAYPKEFAAHLLVLEQQGKQIVVAGS